MDKKEILYWKERYNKEEDLYSKGEEDYLRSKFRKNKFITKVDLIRIVKWKFQGRLLGRQKRILKLLGKVNDKFIREASKLSFRTPYDELRLRLFSSISGVGYALGSVILTFYDLQNYGVLDIHAWRGIFGKEPNDLFTNIQRPLQFLNKLREISSKTELSCRDIEKAFFKRDLES